MKLNAKILTGAAITVLLTTVASIITVYQLSTKNRIVELHEKMSSVIQQSESVASSMDYMHKNDAFDNEGLLKRAREQANGRPLMEVYSSTAFYSTIPIVASWKSVEATAQKYGFKFFTPSRPGLLARNPKNNNGADFAEAFKAFEKGEKEYFFHDKDNKQLVLARPVHVSVSCLTCHGDPAKSPTGNGKDVLGFPMENMKLDDIKGAFILKAPISDDPVVRATATAMATVGGIVLMISLGGFYCFSRRNIVRPLTMALEQIDCASEQTAAAAAQVASASQTLAEGASEQAASLEETSASLEEMTSMVKRNAEAAIKAKTLANETRITADTGTADMAEMKDAMNEIKTSSAEVAKIVKVIDEIAFQTNILALNAAVEAARAGEVGMGFAVVADEVRNLAQRSAASAKETADKIEDAIAKSERGVQISVKVSASFDQIAGKTREVDKYVAEIASASQEQAQGVSQVNAAVTHMDKVTQSNAASAKESASASEELNAQAASVKKSVQTLQQLVGGGAPASEGAVTGEAVAGASAWQQPAAKRTARAHGNSAQMHGGHRSGAAQPVPAGDHEDHSASFFNPVRH